MFAMGKCKVGQLLFADGLVLLFSSESGFQLALNSFAAAYDFFNENQHFQN